MLDALQKIDTSPIDELLRIKKEQDVLANRLEKMQAAREKVSDAVFERVHDDYSKRNAAFEEQARPLKADARKQYVGLKRCHDEITAKLEAAKLDKEEIEFRHELGEFEEDDFKQRLDASKKTIAGHEKDLKDADALRKQFLAAFKSEEELDQPVAKPASKQAPAEKPAAKAAAAAKSAPSTDKNKAAPPDDGATQFVNLGASKPSGAPAGDGNQTMVLRRAVLVDRSGKQPTSHPVSFLGSVVGSGEDAQIRVSGKKVDAEHAEVRMVEDGAYVVRRLSRSGAITVNGASVADEVELDHGDTLLIGDVELIFDNGK